MAYPTAVNSQITDAVTQANVCTVGQAPGVALAALSQSMTTSLSIMFANAVNAQQQMNITAQAATTMGVSTIMDVGTASSAVGIADILRESGSQNGAGGKNGK